MRVTILTAEIYLIGLPNKQQYHFLYLVDFCRNHEGVILGTSTFYEIMLFRLN